MRTWGFLLGVCLAAALLLFPQSPDAAQVVSVTLCKDVVDPDLVPIDIAEEFSTKAPLIHAIVSVKNARDGTVVGGAWVSVNAIATPNYEIDAMELKMKAGDGVLHFSISKPDKDWPTGDYKLEVSIDGKLAAVKTFTIVPEPGAGTSGGPGASAQARAKEPAGQGNAEPSAPAGAAGTGPAGGGFGYAGTYVMENQGNRITLVLNEDSQGMLTGTLSSTTGMQFQVEGQAEEGAAYGACGNGEMGAFFEAYLDGGNLWFSLIEADANNMPDYDKAQQLMFTRLGGGPSPAPTPPAAMGTPSGATQGAGDAPAPGGQGAGGQAPTRTGAPAEAAAGGAVSRGGGSGGMYRHPAGFNFLYPEGWTTKITEDILQLIPPNAGSSPEGPTEVYMVLGESVAGEGIFSAEDPRVVEYMDQQVRSLSPTLTLQGGAKPVSMSQGTGAELTWEGTSPRGDVIQARAFVAIMKNHGISLIGIALKNLLQARDADMRQIFSSFGVGEGENDPAIVGSWVLVSTSAIDNQSPFETAWSRAQAVSETQTILDLRPDGTCTWNSKNQTIVGAGDVWLEDNSSSTSQGRWNAGNSIIYIIWDDNTVRDCMYKLEYVGGKPRLRMACGGKGEVWEPAG